MVQESQASSFLEDGTPLASRVVLEVTGHLSHAKCRAGRSTAGIKIARRNIINLRYADDTTLLAESEEELKSLLIKVKKESEKAGLKFNIQKN